MNTSFYRCVISCSILFCWPISVHAASEDNPSGRHPLREFRAAMRNSHMQASTSESQTQNFYREIQEKIRDPHYRLGTRRDYLDNKQRKLLDFMLDAAQTTHPEGFTNIAAFMLFYGPPGTGKTYLAEGCAGEINANLPQNQPKYKFLYITAAALNQGYASDGTQRTQVLVQCLKRNRPIIAVIDEIDGLMNRVNSGNDSASKNLEHTTTELWTQLDSIKAIRDICVIGITNHELRLDAALQSRLGLTIRFNYLSDAEKINAFIRYHMNCPGYSFSEDIIWPHTSFYYRYIGSADLSHREIEFFMSYARRNSSAENTTSSGARLVAQPDVDAAWKELIANRKRPWITRETWESGREKLYMVAAGATTVGSLLGAAVATCVLRAHLRPQQSQSENENRRS